MRQNIRYLLILLGLLMTACSSRSDSAGSITLIPTTATTTTAVHVPELPDEGLGEYVPVSELSTFPGCGLDAVICASFPTASQTMPEEPTVVAMYDEAGEEVAYATTFLDVATQQGEPVVCRNFMSFGCPDEAVDPRSVASEEYSIRSIPAFKPGYTLAQLSNCFEGALPLSQEPVVISGVDALKTSCILPPYPDGRFDFIIVIVDKKAYEIAASSDIGLPSQEVAFFDSVAIAVGS